MVQQQVNESRVLSKRGGLRKELFPGTSSDDGGEQGDEGARATAGADGEATSADGEATGNHARRGPRYPTDWGQWRVVRQLVRSKLCRVLSVGRLRVSFQEWCLVTQGGYAQRLLRLSRAYGAIQRSALSRRRGRAALLKALLTKAVWGATRRYAVEFGWVMEALLRWRRVGQIGRTSQQTLQRWDQLGLMLDARLCTGGCAYPSWLHQRGLRTFRMRGVRRPSAGVLSWCEWWKYCLLSRWWECWVGCAHSIRGWWLLRRYWRHWKVSVGCRRLIRMWARRHNRCTPLCLTLESRGASHLPVDQIFTEALIVHFRGSG